MNQTATLNQTHEGKIERPIAITVICILGFIGAVLSVPMVFSDIARQIGSWFPPYSGITAAISLTCMIGLWFTKRWAVYAYIGLVMLNQIVLLAMDRWNVWVLVVHGIIVTVSLFHLDAKARVLLSQLGRCARQQVWAIIVAYMVGIHNFYREEQKEPDDIIIIIEDTEEQEDNAPKI